MKWFKNITTLEELRREYRRLAVLHHPDKGGQTSDMQEINNEYDILSKRLIAGNSNFSDSRKVYETQVSEDLKEMIGKVINLEGVIVEVIGSWIWLTGKTREHQEYIKSIGFNWSSNKFAWYFHVGNYRKFNKSHYDLDAIRAMWGSEIVEKEEREGRRQEAIYS